MFSTSWTFLEKRKPNGQKETRGKQAFRRDLHERAAIYPDFKTEFGHLEWDTIVGEKQVISKLPLINTLKYIKCFEEIIQVTRHFFYKAMISIIYPWFLQWFKF